MLYNLKPPSFGPNSQNRRNFMHASLKTCTAVNHLRAEAHANVRQPRSSTPKCSSARTTPPLSTEAVT